jgi:hypothetical protein
VISLDPDFVGQAAKTPSPLPGKRCKTDQETVFWRFQNVKLSPEHPFSNRASIYVTNERRLTQCHHFGLCIAYRAAREKWKWNATIDDDLVHFNGDPGSPLTQVPSSFRLG